MRIHELPRPVREALSKIANADVATDGAVLAAQEELANARARTCALRDDASAAEASLAKLAQIVADREAQVISLGEHRASLAARLADGEDVDSDDADTVATLANEQRSIDLHKMALVTVRARVTSAQAAHSRASGREGDAEIVVAAAIESARLDRAWAVVRA